MSLATAAGQWARDVRFAARSLARDRWMALAAVVTLALGLGANTAIFTVLYNAVLRPLPYPSADSLVHVRRLITTDERGSRPTRFSYDDYRSLVESVRSCEAIAAYATEPVTLTGGGAAERITAEIVSANYFSMLELTPTLGRLFAPADERASREPLVVLSSALWASRFAGRREIIGEAIRVFGATLTVAGVAPPGFKGDSRRADIWVTAATADRVLGLEPQFEIIARLRDGSTLAHAHSEVQAIVPRLAPPGRFRVEGSAVPLADSHRDARLTTVLAVLYGAVVCIVLIACANVAYLLLARGLRRRRDYAIRLSLGAGRGALLRPQLTEALLLSLAGAFPALLLAGWVLDVLSALPSAAAIDVWPTFARELDAGAFELNRMIVAFGFASSFATATLCSVAPAVLLHTSDLRSALVADSSSKASSAAASPARAIVAGQVALVVVLLIGAGVMLRSFERLLDRPLGIDPAGILTFHLSVPQTRYTNERTVAFFERLHERLVALPGVTSVARVRHLPLIERGTVTPTRLESTDDPLYAGYNAVDPSFFTVFGAALRDGRVFNMSDTSTSPPVIILSESAAAHLFGSAPAVGKRVFAMNTWSEVVGVIADIRYEPQRPQLPIVGDVYANMRQRTPRAAYIAGRTRGDPRGLLPAIRAAVAELDPELPLSDVTTMTERLRSVQSYARFTTIGLATLAALALVLAIVGISGTVAYAVASRRREIGIRIALGAAPFQVVRLFAAEALTVCGIGAAIGIAAAFGLTRSMRSILYETAPTEPVAFAAALLVVALAAMLACVVPARHAASVDPSITLRHG